MQSTALYLRKPADGDLTAAGVSSVVTIPPNLSNVGKYSTAVSVPKFVPGTALRFQLQERRDANANWGRRFFSPWMTDLLTVGTGASKVWKMDDVAAVAPAANGQYGFGPSAPTAWGSSTFAAIRGQSFGSWYKNDADGNDIKPLLADIKKDDYLVYYWGPNAWATYLVSADSVETGDYRTADLAAVAYDDTLFDPAFSIADAKPVYFLHRKAGSIEKDRGFRFAMELGTTGGQVRVSWEVRGANANFGKVAAYVGDCTELPQPFGPQVPGEDRGGALGVQWQRAYWLRG